MPKYIAEFAFKHIDSALRPDDQKWGYALLPIDTDKEPETEEEIKEVTKHIFANIPDCEAVRLIRVFADNGELDAPANASGVTPYIEGEIID